MLLEVLREWRWSTITLRVKPKGMDVCSVLKRLVEIDAMHAREIERVVSSGCVCVLFNGSTRSRIYDPCPKPMDLNGTLLDDGIREPVSVLTRFAFKQTGRKPFRCEMLFEMGVSWLSSKCALPLHPLLLKVLC